MMGKIRQNNTHTQTTRYKNIRFVYIHKKKLFSHVHQSNDNNNIDNKIKNEKEEEEKQQHNEFVTIDSILRSKLTAEQMILFL